MKKVVLVLLIVFFVSCEGDRLPIQTAVYPGGDRIESVSKGIPDNAKALADPAFARSIEDYFAKAINNGQILGAAVAVVGKDGLLYQNGFGKRSAKSGEKIDEHTVFRIGSLSKSVSGVLMGIIIDDQLLDWEDKVVDHLPNFQLSNTSHGQQVSLKHLLSHSSGLPYHTYTNLVEAGISLEEITKELKGVTDLQALGQVFSYQNAAFALSGEMAQKVTNQEMPSLLQERLFDPLEMKDASADYESMMAKENKALPHKGGQGQWWPVAINQKYYNAVGAGGVNASISDMAELLYLMLGQRADVLQPTTLEKITTPEITTKDIYRYYQKWNGHEESYYGMGWRIHTFDLPDGRDTLLHHGGYVNGFRSEIAISKKMDIGICVLFNNPNRVSQTCIPDILEMHKSIQLGPPAPKTK